MTPIYLVAPEVLRLRQLVARAGWTVYLDPSLALEEVNGNFLDRAKRGKNIPFRPGIFVAEVETDVLNPYTENMLWKEGLRPKLAKDVRGWRRFTKEDLTAWLAERRLSGSSLPPLSMLEVWAGLLPGERSKKVRSTHGRGRSGT